MPEPADRPDARRIEVIIGDYPATAALRAGRVRPDGEAFSIRPGPVLPRFRPFLEQLDADIAEIPIMTFLAAVEAGAPLVLLPAVVLSGPQHGYLVHDPARGLTGPKSLAGRRVAVRSHTVTTVTWIRDILETEHGVDTGDVTWIACEAPHVAGYASPANVERAPEGATPDTLLAAGDADAAVLRRLPEGSPVVPLIARSDVAGAAWQAREGAVQINHMICTTRDFAGRAPEAVEAFLRALAESAGQAGPDGSALLLGRAAVGPSLKKAIACARRQGIIMRAVPHQAIPFAPKAALLQRRLDAF